MITRGNTIIHKKTKTKHIVESVDYYDDVTLIFTEDIKYFPIDDVELYKEFKISNYFMRLFNNQKNNKNEDNEICEILRSHKVVQIIGTTESIKKDLEIFIKKIHNN